MPSSRKEKHKGPNGHVNGTKTLELKRDATPDRLVTNGSSQAKSTGQATRGTHDRPFVSIIVVNYDGIKVLPKCLAALAELKYPNFEVILVDNGSTDGSIEFAEDFSPKFTLHILKFPTNRGLAVARNAGVKMGKGRFFAFVDNDGFPHPDWLDRAIDGFGDNPKVGVIASLVVFDRRPDIINGLGGGVDARGVGFDFLYHRPIGHHDVPAEILYPMGCGMVVSGELAKLIFPIDDLLVNYYDDVEIGIRAWNCGYVVKPCPEARISHSFNHSSRASATSKLNKEILCHRNRVRTALKYFPLSKLPSFIWNETITLAYFAWEKRNGFRSIFLWNLWNLRSALAIRAQFPRPADRGTFPTWLPKETRDYPKNTDFLPKWENIREVVDMESPYHADSLDFGWYYQEPILQVPFRFTSDVASAFLRTNVEVDSFLLRFVSYTEEPFTVELLERDKDEVLYKWQYTSEIFTIRSVHEIVQLPPGDYQVRITCDFAEDSDSGRILGVAINFMGLWSLN